MYEPEHLPVLLGMVFYVSRSNFHLIRKEMMIVARQMNEEERLYVYHPNYERLSPRPSHAIAAIGNYRVVPFGFYDAIRKVLDVMGQEDLDVERHIFVVMDHLPRLETMKLILKRNEPSLFSQFANYHFFGICGCQDTDLPGFEQQTPDSLRKRILSIFKKPPHPFLLNNYQPLDLEKIKEDYRKIHGKKSKQRDRDKSEASEA